jgi:lysophospholipase L1-like esterase
MFTALAARMSFIVSRTILITVFANTIGSSAAAQTAQFTPPRRYYLALGDSIAFGYQAWKARAGLPAAAFDTGYVDIFAERLRQIQPDLTVVNYSCPGETTNSFITGPCAWSSHGGELHNAFSGAQLDAAVAFLNAHRGQVSPITVTLWGNDVREFATSCPDLTCVAQGAPAFIARLTDNLAVILNRLRVAAPDAEIIVTGSWDSFLDSLEFADPLFQFLNGSMSATTTVVRARFADPFPIFNPQRDLNAEIEAMCALTLLCSQGDSHPSDAGYQALGNLVFEISDYARLTN